MAMALPSCNLLATAFLVGYGLPSTSSQDPSLQQRRAVAPLDRLSVRRVRVTKRTRVKVMVSERSLYLLAGGLDPGHFKISSEERRALRWELNIRRTFLHRCAGRRGFQKIFRMHGSARSEKEEESAAEPLFMEGEHPASCGKKASGDPANQPAHRAEKKGRLAHRRAHPGDGSKAITGQFPSKSMSSRSPDEIQHYMRMKSQLRTKEQKEAAAQAHAAAVARKEKMKALEIERRARLRLEAISGKGRSETLQRPQWDSSTLTPASEVNGPWLNVSDLTVAVDFPLPKPVDADGFSSLCLGSKSNLESLQDSTEASENVLEVSKVNAGRSSEVAWWPSEKSSRGKHQPGNDNQCRVYSNKNLVSQQAFEETKSIRTPIDLKEWSKCDIKGKSLPPTQYLKEGTKELMMFSLGNTRTSNPKQQRQLLAADLKRSHPPLRRTFSRHLPQEDTLSQDPYNMEDSTQLSCHDALGQNLCLQNSKRKAPTLSITDQSAKAYQRRHKMPARTKPYPLEMKFLNTENLLVLNPAGQRAHPTTACNVADQTDGDLKERQGRHTRYITYHLEKFPYRYTVEALTERKRVALLKLLAQQLVSRLDAAQTLPSCLVHDGNAQAHTFSLRSNLENFQKKLCTIEKALEGNHSQISSKKITGYIVLPSKLERSGNSLTKATKQPRGSQEASELLQIKDALSKKAALLYSPLRDFSSQTAASVVSVSSDCSLPQRSITTRHHRESDKDIFQDQDALDSTTLWEGRKEEGLEVKKLDDLNQDFESRLQSFWMDFRGDAMTRENCAWDHQLLDKELEKLDAEIKETKSRMSRNLLLTHPPLADKFFVTSPVSSSPGCNDNLTSLVEREWSQISTAVNVNAAGKEVFPGLTEAGLKQGCLHDDGKELLALPLEEYTNRKYDGSTLDENHYIEKDVKKNVDWEAEKVEKVYAKILNDSCECSIELPSHTASDYLTISSTTLQSPSCINARPSSGSSTEDILTHPPVLGKGEVSELMPEQDSAGSFTNIFRKQRKRNHEVLTDFITDTLMQELLQDELSDMVLHFKASLCLSHHKRIRNDPLKSTNVDYASTGIYSPGAGRLHHLLDKPNSVCTALVSSSLPFQENSKVYVAVTNDEIDSGHTSYPSYGDFTTADCSTVVKGSDGIHRESFKTISKRLVDKYVNETLEAHGLLCSSSLLGLYASDITMSSNVAEQSIERHELEDQIYGKVLLEAVCECLDKHYLRFCLPSFLLFLQPCPEGPHLKQILISKVNEHADAACEGGFSLEHILEKSLDEEDWKSPYCEMTEVVRDISEHVVMDMIDSFLQELMNMKNLAQVATVSMCSAEWGALCC